MRRNFLKLLVYAQIPQKQKKRQKKNGTSFMRQVRNVFLLVVAFNLKATSCIV